MTGNELSQAQQQCRRLRPGKEPNVVSSTIAEVAADHWVRDATVSAIARSEICDSHLPSSIYHVLSEAVYFFFGATMVVAANIESGKFWLYFTSLMKRWFAFSPFFCRVVLKGVITPCTLR
jgi:hypothetical protein